MKGLYSKRLTSKGDYFWNFPVTDVNQYFFSPGLIWGSAELCFSSTCVNRSCTSATSDFRDLTLPSTSTHSALRFMAGTLSGVKKVKLIS